MNRSAIFLAAYRETGSVSKAALAAQIDRSIHYRRLRNDPEYAEAFRNSTEIAVATLEDAAVQRAIEGELRPVFYRGKACGAIREKSDTLLMFLLRGAKPEKYRERFTGTLETSVTHKFSGSLEDLLATYRTLAQQTETDNPQA